MSLSQRRWRAPKSSHSADMPTDQKDMGTGSDRVPIAVLMLLYMLQGIPMGLCGSLPMLLKEKGATYEALSLFSLVSLPFSMKIFWAPFIDSTFLESVGRRKSWLLPLQLLCGGLLIWGSGFVGSCLESEVPNTRPLTVYFFVLYFLMASQDIVVDGWALTMLSKRNVGYASTCNTMGQALGYFLANQGFLALSDSRWCLRFLGRSTPLLTLPMFMKGSGYVFIVLTIAVCALQRENNAAVQVEGVFAVCRQIVSLFRLPQMRSLTLMLFTCKMAFAPQDAAFSFKLQELGMPKSDLATISPLLLVVGLVLPVLVSSTISSNPLSYFYWGIKAKMITSLLLWFILQFTKTSYSPEGNLPLFLSVLTMGMVLSECCGTLTFVSAMTFFSKISDPAIGGTYMTLLNTIMNLGSKWPTVLILWLLPKLQFSFCFAPVMDGSGDSSCAEPLFVDGYTTAVACCATSGLIWIFAHKNLISALEAHDSDLWKPGNTLDLKST